MRIIFSGPISICETFDGVATDDRTHKLCIMLESLLESSRCTEEGRSTTIWLAVTVCLYKRGVSFDHVIDTAYASGFGHTALHPTRRRVARNYTKMTSDPNRGMPEHDVVLKTTRWQTS